MKYNKNQRRESDKNSGAENNAWTSYSDLFMAVAVVFLIMFVFSILASSASNFQIEQEKKEAEKYWLDKIPDHKTKKITEAKKKTKDNIKSMQRKRQLLEVSLAQISQIAKTLQENQGATEKLYETQLKQEEQLDEANKLIQQKRLILLVSKII